MQILKETIGEKESVYLISPSDEIWKNAILSEEQKEISNLALPGFRKGHIPKNIAIKSINNEKVLYNSANKLSNSLMDDFYNSEKIKNNKKILLASVSAQIDTLNANSLIIKILIDNKPEIKIDEYKNWKFDFKIPSVDEKEINFTIKKLIKKDSIATVKNDGNAIENGDLVKFDYKGYIDDKPLPNGEAKDYELEIGSGQFIEGFESQMVGLKKGDKKTINVTFPNDYHNSQFSGKNAKFELSINEISSLKYPKLDDEYIKKMNIKDVNNKNDLIKYVKENLMKSKEQILINDLKPKLFKKIEESTSLSFMPVNLYTKHFNERKLQYENNAKKNNVDFEKYLKDELKINSIDDLNKKIKNEVESLIKFSFGRDKLINDLSIKPDENFVEENIQNISKMYMKPVEELKQDNSIINYLQQESIDMNLAKTLLKIK